MPRKRDVVSAQARTGGWLRRLRGPLLLLCGATALALPGCAVWRIGQASQLTRHSFALQQPVQNATLRLLIVGDSTAVGTGASSPQASLAGLMAQAHPQWSIENRAKNGAQFADLLPQLEAPGRFDVVLIQAGGNDVIRLRGLDDLQVDIEQVLTAAKARAPQVIVMPAGNVGNAPFFFVPLSWWMTQRSRALHRLVADSAARHGVQYVNLFHERDADPFVLKPGLHAADGLHPSDAGYREWWQALRTAAGSGMGAGVASGTGLSAPDIKAASPAMTPVAR